MQFILKLLLILYNLFGTPQFQKMLLYAQLYAQQRLFINRLGQMSKLSCSVCRQFFRRQQLTCCCSTSYLICSSCKRNAFCQICKKTYLEKQRYPKSTSIIPQKSKPSSIRPLTAKKICSKCSKSSILCLCKTQKLQRIQHPLTTKKQQTERCDKCHRTSPLSQVFCNIQCGHCLCSECLSNIKKPVCFCGKKIQSNSFKTFKKICFSCDQPISNGKNYSGSQEYLTCIKCKQETQKVQKLSKSQSETSTMNTSKPTSDEEPKEINIIIQKQQIIIPTETDKQKQSSSKKSSFEDPSIMEQREKNKQQLLDKIFPCKIQTEKALTQNQVQVYLQRSSHQAQSSTLGVADRKNSNQTNFCGSCNINCSARSLFTDSQCKKKHKICKICLLRNRKNKTLKCKQCIIEFDRQIQKKLVYQQVLGSKKLQYCQKVYGNMSLCEKCLIMIQKSKMFEGKLCKLCLTQ